VSVLGPTAPLEDFARWFEWVMDRLLFLPVRAADMAKPIDALQAVEFAFFWLIGLALLAAAGWFTLRYRRRTAVPGPTPRIEAPLWFEIGLSGSLLVVFVAFWVVGFGQFVTLASPPPEAMDVYVTGRQWVWKFAYPSGRSSAGVLYVPEGRPVRLLLTSRDVIHSFFVPAFRVKQDALPQRLTTAWFRADRLGRYDVLCAELCGAGHSHMRAAVEVLPLDEFARWLDGEDGVSDEGPVDGPTVLDDDAEPRGEHEDLARRGLDVAAREGCLRCHTTDGTAHVGPTFLGLWRRTVELSDGSRVVADPAYLTRSMMDPRAELVAGFQPLMPSYQGRLDPAATAALLELIKRLEHHAIGSAPPGAGVALRREAER